MSEKAERRALIRIATKLKPAVTVGAAGLAPGVLEELQRALRDHELIKIRFNVVDRENRRATAAQLAEQLDAELIQRVGKTIVLYRPNHDADARLSNISRNSGD